ncbi:MAG: hypothetical protein JXA60_10070 [Candidatus Coatesbacteria bacterium]|nr:hypothetical protein [Candidatus Coatesbacteria bacterium]
MLSVVFLLFINILCQEEDFDTLTIAFTANSEARFGACACPDLPYEGLNKRRAIVDSLKKIDKDVLLIDGGNFISSEYQVFKPEADTLCLDIYNSLEYSVIAIGENELFKGSSMFSNKEFAKMPIIATNIKMINNLPLKPYMRFKKKNLEFAFISLISRETKKSREYKVDDYKDSFRSISKELSGCDFIILVSRLHHSENRWIAYRINAPLLILGEKEKKSSGFSETVTLNKEGKSYIINADEGGGEAVWVRIVWDKKKRELHSIKAGTIKAESRFEDDRIFKQRISKFLSKVHEYYEKKSFKAVDRNKLMPVVIFYKSDCPKCAAVIGMLERIKEIYRDFQIKALDISVSENFYCKEYLNRRFKAKKEIVPAMYFEDNYFVGFEEITNALPKKLFKAIKKFKKNKNVMLIEFFYSYDCEKCKSFLIKKLIPLSLVHPVEIIYYDINVKSNYANLAEIERKHNKTGDIPAALINNDLYIGEDSILKAVEKFINQK